MENQRIQNPVARKWASLGKGKKRYLFLGLIACEIAALPAAAQIFDRVVFEAKPRVVAVEIPNQTAGLRQYLVTSNAPFTLQSEDSFGEMRVSVKRAGAIAGSGARYGDNAQIPGEASHCAAPQTGLSATIYAADRKTAAKPGPVVSQAVIFEIQYDPSAAPKFAFRDDDAKNTAPLAPPCARGNS